MRLTILNQRTVVVAVLCAVLVVWLGLNPSAGAQGRRIPKRTGHINDFAAVIDGPAKQRLEKVLENLQEKTGIDFVVTTVKTSGNEDLYDYSLRVASSWNVGPASREDSVLLVVASDSANFLTHVSSSARAKVSDAVISETGKSLREQIGNSAFSAALTAGVKTFVDQLGAKNNFSFASLDPQGGETLVAVQERPRKVESPSAQPSENPQPTPAAVPTPGEIASPQASPEMSATPLARPSETAAPVASSPSPSVMPTETPAPNLSPSPAETPAATPAEVATAQPSPSASAESLATNSRSAKTSDKKSSTTPANPEDEKEEVELTLTLPLDKRIEALKAFIAAHPTSVALPRANELIVMAHALLGEQKLQAGDNAAGLQQFRLAISDAPADMPDRLFSEVIARIPLNLFFRGQRDVAFEMARQAETLAKPRAKRLLALAEFYLAVENADEAARLAEAALQLERDLAQGHQALAAARHIALRLDEAESEYARAFALDPKSAAARIGLADLKRAGGNAEAALALYRQQLQVDSKSNPARAGMILSLLELGKKEEAETELSAALQDKDQSRNLPLLVGTAYWFMAHNDPVRGLDMAQKAVTLEPRYSWAEIALARATIADKRLQPAERGLRFARQYSRFPTLDYELASALASMGLFDEAVVELKRSFTLKNGEIETKLAGRTAAHAATFTELLAPERRAAIFQKTAADTEANANMLKGLFAFDAALNQASMSEDDLLAVAQQFIKGDDAMRTYRQVYVAGRFVKKGVALSSVVDLMDQAMSGVEVALSVPAATVAVQTEELGDVRARAIAQGETPEVPDAPRTALSGILRGRIEDYAGLALFNLDKPAEAVTRLRRAVSGSTEGTPIWRSALWHLGAALEATGKHDQALLYYIKSYVHGPPDPARRSIIESVYKKVNGTLDGLDDKIGAAAAGTSATPSPTPSPK
jgi:tetratricopeptide (TPR) repeat protein